MTTEDRTDELEDLRERALQGGGQERIDRQHEKGKLTARERVDYFLDEDSFVEFDQLRTHRSSNFGLEERQVPGDGVVAGYGEVDGRTVFVFAHDFTVFGGSLGEVFAEKVCKVMDRATDRTGPRRPASGC